MKTKVKGVV